MECCELYGASLSRLLATRHSLLQQLQQQLDKELQQPYMHAPAATTAAELACELSNSTTAVAEHQEKDTCLQQQHTQAAECAAAGQLHPLQLLDQLAGNLQREHVLRSMLKCFVWGRILDSVQFAKAAVYSHPLFPDVHAIVCVLHKQQQQQQAQVAPGLE